ncbi:pyridoxamine 5'-phosphate oxidase [Kytococcus sedentarius]|uniref:pyridoxamine 5'-phosphate oxidase n=1 Tax=Kytococcus sedentarius TaxID=1276 RepID=UPI0035BC1252
MHPSDLARLRGRRLQRLEYLGEGLDPASLPVAPWAVVNEWVSMAHHRALERGDVPEPGAMALATVDADGAPDVRTVLCRDVSPEGLRFYTSLVSAKADQIGHDPRVAITWAWPGMFRALRFRGVAQELPREDVTAYFQQRPWGARISAHASLQSHPLGSRAELVAREEELAAQWPDRSRRDDVPTPDHWGGYLVRPYEVEVWTGRQSRMHDRWRWELVEPVDHTQPAAGQRGLLLPMDDDTAWTHSLLQP